MSTYPFIVDLFKPIVEKVSERLTLQLQKEQPLITGVWYDYGHPQNIMENLAHKDVSDIFQNKRYPLICLFQDFNEDVTSKVGICATVSLNFCIVMSSQAEYKPEERYRVNYKPILQPIYNTFMEEIVNSAYFMYPGAKPAHTKTDRIYYGTQRRQTKEGKNDQNAMWDILDGIEISNLQLAIYDECRCLFDN